MGVKSHQAGVSNKYCTFILNYNLQYKQYDINILIFPKILDDIWFDIF